MRTSRLDSLIGKPNYSLLCGTAAFHLHCEAPGIIGDVGGRAVSGGYFTGVMDTVAVEEGCHDRRLDGEIDVLRNVANGVRDLGCIELAFDDADHIATPIEKRAAAVARLDRSRD